MDSHSRTNTLETPISLHHRGKAGISPALSTTDLGSRTFGMSLEILLVSGWKL